VAQKASGINASVEILLTIFSLPATNTENGFRDDFTKEVIT
jgi:hypothetical protein